MSKLDEMLKVKIGHASSCKWRHRCDCGYDLLVADNEEAIAELVRLRSIESSLALAGIPPAALAADPECVRKLVEAARHAHGAALRACADLEPHERQGMRDVIDNTDIALRACGIEVGA